MQTSLLRAVACGHSRSCLQWVCRPHDVRAPATQMSLYMWCRRMKLKRNYHFQQYDDAGHGPLKGKLAATPEADPALKGTP